MGDAGSGVVWVVYVPFRSNDAISGPQHEAERAAKRSVLEPPIRDPQDRRSLACQTRTEGQAGATSPPHDTRKVKPSGANYYAILQVKPFANPATIMRAYRRLAWRAHPDLNPAPDATEQMQVVNEAYAVLRDPTQRTSYDRQRFALALEEAQADIDRNPLPVSVQETFPSARIVHIAGIILSTLGFLTLVWVRLAAGWSLDPAVAAQLADHPEISVATEPSGLADDGDSESAAFAWELD